MCLCKEFRVLILIESSNDEEDDVVPSFLSQSGQGSTYVLLYERLQHTKFQAHQLPCPKVCALHKDLHDLQLRVCTSRSW